MSKSLSLRPEQELEQQRQLISHEIHDGACQYVVAARMMFETFRRGQVSALPNDWRNFDMGLEFLDRASAELRRLAGGLGPLQLSAGDLSKALDSLIEEIEAAGGPDIELCCDIQPDKIPQRLELAAFRIVQESLANACRHSKSNGVLVGLTQEDDTLRIQVQDWGIGCDPNNISDGHYGIKGIRQRVKMLGGIAKIRSNPGEGTLITVELPLKE
ncbi:MAG: sensor histidine kinase [Thermoguttaceae bacterium]